MLQLKSILVIAALLGGASATFADQAEQPLTREAVLAELKRAQAAGQMDGINEAWDGTNFGSSRAPEGVFGRPFEASGGLTREEVIAEYQRALKRGEIARHRMTDGVGGN
jgi:hypothetical protein